MKYFVIILILLCVLFAYFYFYGDDSNINSDKNVKKALSAAEALMGDGTAGYSTADSVIEFYFPRDHGAHDSFKTEWWYFTGNLSSDGNRFGYQFTIFRNAAVPVPDTNKSDWETSQLYLAHFALSDLENNDFYYDERLSRQSVGLAGAEHQLLKIWCEDWQITADYSRGADMPTFNIVAESDNFSIDLTASPDKKPVFHGDEGLSAKSSRKGNASYYYSYTRLNTEGTISVKNKKYDVKGSSWMDREWSTSALEQGQTGWDWFSLQLDDSTEIMFFQLRGKDGITPVFAKGSYIDKSGNKTNIEMNEVTLKVTDKWQNDAGKYYPSGWKFEVPERDISLNIKPIIKDQELKLSIRYWEGAVSISGSKSGRQISGSGFVELTGYSEDKMLR